MDNSTNNRRKDSISLEEQLHNTKLELQAWKEQAMDSQEMLSYLDKHQRTENPAAEFYNPTIKHVTKKLEEDYMILKAQVPDLMKLESADVILRERGTLKQEVLRLKELNQNKFKENQRLQKIIKDSESSIDTSKIKTDYVRHLSKYTALQNENAILKSSLLLRDQTTDHIKKCIDSLKDEFLKLFLFNYKSKGEDFIKAIQNLNEKQIKEEGLPISLLTPLTQSKGTDTREMIEFNYELIKNLNLSSAERKLPDSGQGSAVASITDDAQHSIKMLREMTEKNERLEHENKNLKMEVESLKAKNNQDTLVQDLLKQIDTSDNELKTAKITLSMREKEVHEFKRDLNKKLYENSKLANDIKSLKWQYQQLERKATTHRHQQHPTITPFTPVQEPHVTERPPWNQSFSMSGGLVRDCAQPVDVRGESTSSSGSPPTPPQYFSALSSPRSTISEPHMTERPSWNQPWSSGVLVRDGAQPMDVRDIASSSILPTPLSPQHLPSHSIHRASSVPQQMHSYDVGDAAVTGLSGASASSQYTPSYTPQFPPRQRQNEYSQRANKCDFCFREFPFESLHDHMENCKQRR